jgi:superkiller protein 3
LRLAEQAQARFGEEPGVAARLGRLYFRLKDFDQAEMLLQQALAADPGDIDSHETLGYTYLRHSDFLPAVRCFKRVWHARPLYWSSLFNMAVVYTLWGLDMVRDGRIAFHWNWRGVEIGTRARSARVLDQGHDAYHMGDYGKAAMYYQKVREADANFEVACAWLANCRLKQGRLEDAMEACNRGLARAPASAPLMALLGTLCLAQNKPTNAVRILSKALELSPDHGMGWLTLGRAYQRCGEYRDALDAYGNAVRLDTDDPYLYRHMGDAALALDDRQAAIEAYRVAIERTPRDLVAAQRLIECLFVGRQYEEAIQVCRHALSVDSRCYSAYAWMGRIFRQLQSYTAAREAFEKAIILRPNQGYLYRQLGSLHEQLKEGFEAIEAYEAALRIDAEDGEAQRGLTRAKRMAGKR